MSLLMVRKSAPAHAADAAPKFRVGQEVIVKTKYTDPYRARIVGLWDMSKNGPYDEQGYLIKNIKGGGVESMPEHALSLATAKDSAADKTEKIANDSEIVALWQVLGDAKAYLREGKKNHNVKNVLAAAIKAAEKENPNDRSVAEAKKVLAQFDAAADAGNFKVGDKVLRKGYPAPSPRDYYKVIEVHPNGSVMLDDGFNGYYSPNLIIRATDSNAEAIVNHDRIPVDQLGGEANARKHGYIIAKKGGRVYGVHIDGYSDKLAKKTIEEAGYTVVGDAAEGAAQDFAAMDAITESDLKKHAHDFARYELGKYADELRKKRNSLADIWEKTSIAGGAIRSGEYKQADIDEFVSPYVNAIDDAIRILERI